jgi:hypothetical protein
MMAVQGERSSSGKQILVQTLTAQVALVGQFLGQLATYDDPVDDRLLSGSGQVAKISQNLHIGSAPVQNR